VIENGIYMPTEIEVRDITSLNPYDRNARIHSEEQIQNLAESIRRFGFLRPLLITGDGDIVCGHGRVEAAKLAGLARLPCILAESLTDEQRRAFILADNRLAEQASWDKTLVSAELVRLRDEGFDIGLTGFCEDDIIIDLPQEPFEDDDFDPEPKEGECLEDGTLWQLGEHLLLVGDATIPEDVSLLMGDQTADLLLTDPPYGVDYVGKSLAEGRTANVMRIMNDNFSGNGFFEFLLNAFSNARDFMREGAPFYIWHPDGDPALEFREALREIDLPVHQCLVWVKNSLVLSRQDYHWQHEPCLYGWKPGADHAWHSDRKQSTVMEFDRPTKSLEHPTMKPVKLFAYQIGNSTLQGDIVLDLFAGSGTTVIACEELNRKARCIEKDGCYAAVIVRRWETMTGKKAVLLHE